jgi:hypothetical protein
MILIGLFPSFFINALNAPVRLFTEHIVFNMTLIKVSTIDSLHTVNWLFFAFIVLVIAIMLLRKYFTRHSSMIKGPTWGCGYSASGSRVQYTASSFVRSYSKLAKPLLDIEKHEVEVNEVFPQEKSYASHIYDRVERIFIDKPLKIINQVIDMFAFLQNGYLQRYILYGIIFITAVICLPLLISNLHAVIIFLNNL